MLATDLSYQPVSLIQKHSSMEYPYLFQEYLLRALKAVLRAVCNSDTLLNDTVRDDALHLLDFSLQLDSSGSLTSKLLLAMAPKMELAGFRDDWIAFLLRGVQQCERTHDLAATAEFCFQIGYLYRLRSKFDDAVHWLRKSTTIAQQLNQPSLEAKAINQLAYIAWQRHEYQNAYELAEQAMCSLDESHPERAMSLSVLGLVTFHQKLFVESERYHREALRIREINHDERAIAWSQQNLGAALREQNRNAEALGCYQTAITILDRTQDTANRAIAQMNLGIVYRRLERHQKSLELHIEAGKIFHKLGDRLNLANNYTNIGLQHLTLEDYDSAAEAFVESSKLFFEIGNLSWALNARDGLGIVYLKQQKFTEAYDTFQHILTTLPSINDPPMFEYLQRVVPSQLNEAKNGKTGA